MEINVNASCRVTLEKLGIECLDIQYDNSGVSHGYKIGDKYDGPLWDLMNTFGPKCTMGIGRSLFKNNMIEIEV